MTRTSVLAAAQTIARAGDVEANIEQHARLASVAASQHVGVLVFPELSLTGYELALANDLAFSRDDRRLLPLVELSRIHQITLIVGAPVRLKHLHIGAFVFSSSGTVALYTKRYLGEGEDVVVQAGDCDPLLHLGNTTGAVAVCADANRSEHPQAAADRGADTYLVSSFINPSQFSGREAMLRGYAATHAMTVVFANYGGPSGGEASAGRSALWSNRGDVIAQLEGVGLGLVVATAEPAGWRGAVIEIEET